MKFQRRAIVLGMASSPVWGCRFGAATELVPMDTAGNATIDKIITIKLGQSGESFVLANGRERVNVKREPAGLNFYKVRWQINQLGVAHVDHGIHSFRIENVLSCSGTEDAELLDEGIGVFRFNAAPTNLETIAHLEARDHLFGLLHMLGAAGWRRYIFRAQPRLIGRDALEYSIKKFGVYGLDPDYLPTLDEWMRLDDGARWRLYAAGVYLTIQFMRDSERMNPKEPGAYLLIFELKSETSDSREYFAPEDRSRWLELWPARKKELERERAEAEAKARAQGLAIDTTYTDPPVLALQQGGRP